MHEMSLAHSMMQQVLALAREHKASQVNSITVLLGPFSGVVAESFAFAFEILKKNETCLHNAVLHLECPDPRYRCLGCGAETSLPVPGQGARAHLDFDFFTEKQCPACASTRLSPLGGRELILQQIRME